MYLFVSHSFSLEVIVDVFLTTRDGFRPGNIRLELLVVGPFLMDCRWFVIKQELIFLDLFIVSNTDWMSSVVLILHPSYRWVFFELYYTSLLFWLSLTAGKFSQFLCRVCILFLVFTIFEFVESLLDKVRLRFLAWPFFIILIVIVFNHPLLAFKFFLLAYNFIFFHQLHDFVLIYHRFYILALLARVNRLFRLHSL